ncbi:hypothetical protein B0H10DRAFT_1966076 [Mycena sp. CBHHK59/15]|nr:hypothetical protein B0H10DRAFT_1966076 [Mycena sp. CBHHK59/15]
MSQLPTRHSRRLEGQPASPQPDLPARMHRSRAQIPPVALSATDQSLRDGAASPMEFEPTNQNVDVQNQILPRLVHFLPLRPHSLTIWMEAAKLVDGQPVLFPALSHLSVVWQQQQVWPVYHEIRRTGTDRHRQAYIKGERSAAICAADKLPCNSKCNSAKALWKLPDQVPASCCTPSTQAWFAPGVT